MTTYICDRCGRTILQSETRYVARIQVLAAADPLEITAEDLQKSHKSEIDALIEKCKEMTDAELMEDVYVAFEFDLCRPCQRAYIRQPIQKI